jgi:hypothetical protein
MGADERASRGRTVSTRIPPLEPVPEYQPLAVKTPKYKKSMPPAVNVHIKVRPALTGHLSQEMLSDKEVLRNYLKKESRIIARELAEKLGPTGFTASNLRQLGEARGKWSNTQFKGKEFSFLPGLFKSMGLICTNRVMLSKIKTTRNDNHYWVLPQYAEKKRVG